MFNVQRSRRSSVVSLILSPTISLTRSMTSFNLYWYTGWLPEAPSLDGALMSVCHTMTGGILLKSMNVSTIDRARAAG